MSPYVNVSSRTAGDASGKEHNHVLADIGELIEKVERSDVRTWNFNESKFGLINFIESTYMDKRNRKKPEYLLTEDGFSLLVFGYSGKNAMDFKLALLCLLMLYNLKHPHALRDIEDLIEKVDQSDERTGHISRSKFGSSNFIKSTYLSGRNMEYPEYLLTRDGFTFIVTGYEGE